MGTVANGFYGFKPNVSGIRAVLKSEGVQSELRAACDPIAERANANKQSKRAEYKVYVDVGRYTAIGKVVCGNLAARFDNAHHNTILKSR